MNIKDFYKMDDANEEDITNPDEGKDFFKNITYQISKFDKFLIDYLIKCKLTLQIKIININRFSKY